MSRIGLVTVALLIQRDRTMVRGWSPMLELRLGRGFVSFEESEDMLLSGFLTGSASAGLSETGSAPLAELHAGARRSWGRYAAYAAAGYRYCNIPGPPFDLDVSGYVLTLGVSR